MIRIVPRPSSSHPRRWNSCNWREITEQVRAEALAQAEARGLDAPLVWAAAEGWHPGVVGIVASRLKEAAHRPAVVIGFDGVVKPHRRLGDKVEHGR